VSVGLVGALLTLRRPFAGVSPDLNSTPIPVEFAVVATAADRCDARCS
jgi:hypothetical protein